MLWCCDYLHNIQSQLFSAGVAHLRALATLGVSRNDHNLTLKQLLHEGVFFLPYWKVFSFFQKFIVTWWIWQAIERVKFQVLTGQNSLLIPVTGVQGLGEVAFFGGRAGTFQGCCFHPVQGSLSRRHPPAKPSANSAVPCTDSDVPARRTAGQGSRPPTPGCVRSLPRRLAPALFFASTDGR